MQDVKVITNQVVIVVNLVAHQANSMISSHSTQTILEEHIRQL